MNEITRRTILKLSRPDRVQSFPDGMGGMIIKASWLDIGEMIQAHEESTIGNRIILSLPGGGRAEFDFPAHLIRR